MQWPKRIGNVLVACCLLASFWKTVFFTIFDPFLLLKRPIFKALGDFPGPLTRHHWLKTA